MNTSPNGIALIKKFEGCELKAYPDPGTGGEPWTIGYGNTFYEDKTKVKKGDVITMERAEKLMMNLLPKYEAVVNKKVTVPLTQNQYDALVCFVWNTGGSDTIFKNINTNVAAAETYKFWTTHYISGGGKVLNGLITRRKEEADLFMKS